MFLYEGEKSGRWTTKVEEEAEEEEKDGENEEGVKALMGFKVEWRENVELHLMDESPV